MTLDPRDEAILDELLQFATDPTRGLLQFKSRVSAHQYLPLYRMVHRHVPPGAEVLDWGCGNGHFSYFLVRSGHRATGFSIDPIGFTSWLGDPTYTAVQGRHDEPVKLPFPDARFDAVSSVGVLEHVRETAGSEPASLAEIVRVLRPGGVFVCYHFPNRHSVIDWLARRVPGLHYHDFRYTYRDIAGFVRGAGLELLECRRYALLPRNSTYHLPHALRYSRALARAWDAVDGALAVPFGGVAQNYRFVARKPR